MADKNQVANNGINLCNCILNWKELTYSTEVSGHILTCQNIILKVYTQFLEKEHVFVQKLPQQQSLGPFSWEFWNSECCNDKKPWEINTNSKSEVSHFKNSNLMNDEYWSSFIPL